jgi:hypothetical protein
MTDTTLAEPVILVGDQGAKAAGLSKKGIPCIVFPNQALAEKWRGRLNAINAAENHKLRISNYEVTLEMLKERDEQMHALVVSLLQQVAPVDEYDPGAGFNHTAWRLTQMLEGMLSAAKPRDAVRAQLLMGLQYV